MIVDDGILGSFSPDTGPFAGFWRRAGAMLLDVLFLQLCVFALVGIALLSGSSLNDLQILFLSNGIPNIQNLSLAGVVLAAYFIVPPALPAQGTLGKHFCGIIITDVYGERISLLRSAWRFLMQGVSAVTLCLGFLMAAFHPRKRALHDMAAGTLVFRWAHSHFWLAFVSFAVIYGIAFFMITNSDALYLPPASPTVERPETTRSTTLAAQADFGRVFGRLPGSLQAEVERDYRMLKRRYVLQEITDQEYVREAERIHRAIADYNPKLGAELERNGVVVPPIMMPDELPEPFRTQEILRQTGLQVKLERRQITQAEFNRQSAFYVSPQDLPALREAWQRESGR